MRIPAFPMFAAPTRRKTAKRKRASTKKAKKATRRANPVTPTQKFYHYTARPKGQFVGTKYATLSLSQARANKAVAADLKAMVAKIKKRARQGGTPSGSRPGFRWGLGILPKGTQIRVAKFKATAKGDRPKGVRVKYLASGIQGILVPKPASKVAKKKAPKKKVAKRKAPAKKRQATTKKAARRPAKRGARRSNPGRLMVLNPLPKHIEKLRNTLSPAERKEFDQALRRFIRFHGGAFPSKVAKIGQAPGKQKRFLVGMGKAKEVGYEANKGYKGSNKNGTAWLHQFKGNPHMATTADGKQILVLNKTGARRRFKVTDWVRG